MMSSSPLHWLAALRVDKLRPINSKCVWKFGLHIVFARSIFAPSCKRRVERPLSASISVKYILSLFFLFSIYYSFVCLFFYVLLLLFPLLFILVPSNSSTLFKAYSTSSFYFSYLGFSYLPHSSFSISFTLSFSLVSGRELWPSFISTYQICPSIYGIFLLKLVYLHMVCACPPKRVAS